MEGRRVPEPVPDVDMGNYADSDWGEIVRFLDHEDDTGRYLNIQSPPPLSLPPRGQHLHASGSFSDRRMLPSTAVAGSVSRFGAQVSEGFGIPSAQQLGAFAPQMSSLRPRTDADQPPTAPWDIERPISSSSYMHTDELALNLFRQTPHDFPLQTSLQSNPQFQQHQFLADESGRLPEWPNYISSLIGPGVSAEKSDLVLSGTPTSSASSEGPEEDSSSQEKNVQAVPGAIISGEAQTCDKAKEEPKRVSKDELPHSEEKTRGKLPRMKKPKKQRGPKFAIRTKCEVDIIDDGYKWRKYGQKAVKNSPYPRSYYKCTDKQCGVKKHVERQVEDPFFVVTTYEGVHNHSSPAPVSVIHRPIGNIPQLFPFSLPLQMGLFSVPQSSYNLLEQVPNLQQEVFESGRDQGLLEDVIPGELRRRSI